MKETITVDQYIFCRTYAEAVNISKSFKNFSFRFASLGKSRIVHAKRFIYKAGTQDNPYRVVIRYVLPYDGSFDECGYLDAPTQIKYPELPKKLLDLPEFDRVELIIEYNYKSNEDDHNIVFFRDFEHFLKSSLSKLLNTLHLATVIAFGNQYASYGFGIYYKEKEQYWERPFFADKASMGCLSNNHLSQYMKKVLPMESVWNWMKQSYYKPKDRWCSEVRSLTALSYVINRTSFECLLYSAIGLESIYTKSEKRVKQQLKDTIPKVFPEFTEAEIDLIYSKRSDFVHGDVFFPMNESYRSHSTDGEFEYRRIAEKASALLLASIRTLVEMDASQIVLDVDGNIVFRKNLPPWRDQTI